MTWTLECNGEERTFEDKEELDEMTDLLDAQGEDYEVLTTDGAGPQATDDTQPDESTTATVADHALDRAETELGAGAVDTDAALDDLGDSLSTDPLDILPDHMIDYIKGQPAVSKRGYAMIAERYDIETQADIIKYPWGNDENRCVARATATTDDGKEYSGWASACAGDGDMSGEIIELAETRALKRSISWASGVGIVSYQEMADEL